MLKSTMGIDKIQNLNHLMKLWKKNTVITAKTLKKMGYSYQLLDKYKKSNWLSSPGKGAYTIAGQNVHWPGAVYALQNDLNFLIRPGGITALGMLGFSHYIRTDNQVIQLFVEKKEKLPLWFMNMNKKENLNIIGTGFLSNARGIPITTMEYGDFSINISAPETAYLEMLFSIPGTTSFEEAYEVSENLTTLRSGFLQKLLEVSTSIKVNRLALYIAEYHQHDWFSKLDSKKINLGKGKRVIQENGRLDNKYNITVPLNGKSFI